ncbi:hypothetical protein PS900_01887 [Pseudomonas fluorescens]|uniref:Uncharacterized protein n=1 Tax=Pseudomonas fluorescens TaxID=294 RepID=A0A8H2NQT6_PSEFL|nr:hypothetical protein PS900_01887 [Pseudomonas fluorescens]
METILMNQHLTCENCEFIKPGDICIDIYLQEVA